MVFNTLTVGAAVTPSVVETYFSHYLNRGPLRHKPTAHISYHEGLRLIREFLDYSSKHTVEDLQSFTSQWVPAPHWVRINDVEVPPSFLDRAARLLQAQLGERGLERIGGPTWWQWRRPEKPLKAEWIEMKKDAHQRTLTGANCERVMLYIHGGAYYFGSVDEHRYQMQRHARKLRAKILSPRYRLAPQFPFPCGLFDCLATYFYLLEHFDPSQIIIAGDSAGGGMVLSMLVTLRDQEQPLPAGTILLSPWVDLTHSFPSVAGDGVGDYIPPHGFHHRPSMAWPPPPSKDTPRQKASPSLPAGAFELPAVLDDEHTEKQSQQNGHPSDTKGADGNLSALPARPPPRFGELLSIDLEGRRVELRDQIQMYTTNELLAHPLVSPVVQPSLGGLPPMLIQTGGAELLRDEQIYLAHKAANPAAYAPSETIMREFDPERKTIEKWPPTNVQLQLWEDLCHVPHTLSFTRPAKYMYRSVAQFAAWALAHAQKHSINIINDDTISIISSGAEEDGRDEEDDHSSFDESSMEKFKTRSSRKAKSSPSVGKAGDPLPPFKDHMIRQRVTRHGILYPLAPVSEMPALALDPSTIGIPKPGPVRKWLATHQASEQKFASERKKTDKKRSKELALGYDTISGERPPPTALVNRLRKGVAPEEKKKGRSWGLAMWSGWGSSHDEQTLQREEKNEKDAQRNLSAASALDLGADKRLLSPHESAERRRSRSTSGSAVGSRSQQRWATSREGERRRSPAASSATAPHEQEVVDAGQTAESSADISRSPSETAPTLRPMSHSLSSPIPVETEETIDEQVMKAANVAANATVPTTSITSPSSERIPGTDHTYLGQSSNRPHNGVQAYPFKLRDTNSRPASTVTLDSQLAEAQVTTTETNIPDNELTSDVNEPVELPSFVEGGVGIGEAEREAHPKVAMVETAREDLPVPTASAAAETTIFSRDLDSSTLNKLEGGGGEAVPSGEKSLLGGTRAEPPAQQKMPFKIRNPVFDNRTSMLGSIGADGMPNAHYAFRREDSPQRSSPELASPDAARSDENAKTTPFKVRHTIYEPDITLGVSKIIDHSGVPEHASSTDEKQVSSMAMNRESGALGNQFPEQRIVGEQRDAPPPTTYISLAHTSATTLGSRLPALPVEDDEDDVPPPPPPKDDSYVPSTRKVTGLRRPMNGSSVGSAQTGGSNGSSGKAGSTPPTLGDLDFESANRSQSNLDSLMTGTK